MGKQVVVGPGTVRVGRFVGRLGVVSLPAVQAGLDLDQRVVRRHVAKLEAAGWLARAPWVWGEGSVVWLTGAGVESAGLGGVRPVKSPPAPTTIAHGVLVGWAVPAPCERGYTEQLPDLAVWLKRSKPPVAVIAESGGRRDDRQRMILEGWANGIWSGRYSGVLYDCASPSVARWIARLAKKIGLTGPEFAAAVKMTAEEIAALSPAASIEEPAVEEPKPSRDVVRAVQAPVRTPPTHPPPVPELSMPEATPAPAREPTETAEERMRRYREILGMHEGKLRRRWRG